ncbi:MAG: iron chelate uptake ABC transporter family permease subunit, partial [Armatimonadetes bacterium]|nr:iron chelate uptake ABC transporter family permease subunit [Armatimonadota bacterium]
MTSQAGLHKRSLPARIALLTGGFGAFLAATVLLAANIGAEPVPLSVIFDSARCYLAGIPVVRDSQLAYIFWQLRLPRVALGAIVGCALAVAGGS